MIISAEEFVALIYSDSREDHYRAYHDSADEETWLDVIERYPDLREEVAHNKTVKGKILEILADDQDSRVRYQVAERRTAGKKILKKLSVDSDESIRAAVVCNAKVTKEILLSLIDDEWERIRELVHIKLEKMNS